MKKMTLLFVVILHFEIAYVQNKISNIDEYLYIHMYKNIAAYNIIRNSYRLSGPARKNLLRSDSDPYYEAFLPDPGFKLDMKMQKLETSYPDTNFILYKIFVGGFDYTNKDDTATMRYLGRPTLQNFLVGLNYKNGEIKYISGQFFTSVIA